MLVGLLKLMSVMLNVQYSPHPLFTVNRFGPQPCHEAQAFSARVQGEREQTLQVQMVEYCRFGWIDLDIFTESLARSFPQESNVKSLFSYFFGL